MSSDDELDFYHSWEAERPPYRTYEVQGQTAQGVEVLVEAAAPSPDKAVRDFMLSAGPGCRIEQIRERI